MNNELIADILKSEISPMELAAAIADGNLGKENLLQTLSDLGHDKARLFCRIASHFGMETRELTTNFPAASNAQWLETEMARRYQVVPLSANEFAVGDPTDIETLDTLRYLFSESIHLIAALPEQITATLNRLYPPVKGEPAMDRAPPTIQSKQNSLNEDDEPIIKLVNLLIFDAFKQRASDIHLEPLSTQFRIRYRIDGALREVEGPPRRLHASVISRLKIMAGMKISEKRLPQDGRIEIRVADRNLDLRVSAIPTNHGESIVMRMLDKRNLTFGLPNLGLHENDEQTFQRLIQYPDGIFLITGPTGSGKTTSLYACLNHLNQPDRKIITVEDPVEYQLNGINQVHVRADIGLTFSTALRSILRQAPNIIMIGEIRDKETAEIAINAALTGHLVLSTLHTNDAPSAITRLTDIGIKPFLVSSSVRGIMAQRLVRTICHSCKTAQTPTDTEQNLIGNIAKTWKGAGCPSCGHSGYLGRKGIFELMNINDHLRQMIYEASPTSTLRAEARALGMHTLREDGFRKVAEGITTTNEVLRATMRNENA